MANFRQLTDDKNALCYVWLTFALLILSVVCFGISTYQNSALYAGILFLVLSVITSSLYCGRRWSAKHPNMSFCEAHCGCCQVCCECCYYGDCCRYILCLPPVQRSQRRRQRAMRRHSNRNRTLETHVVVMNHLGYELSLPTNVATQPHRPSVTSSIQSKLRRFEGDIQKLFQQYSFLQTDGTIANSITIDYNALLHQHELLSDWIENRTTPDERDVHKMKQTLKKIDRSFRLARARFDQDRSIRPDMSVPLSLSATSSVSPSESAIFTTNLDGLPPYQLKDPLQAFDNSVHRQTTSTSQQLNVSDCYSYRSGSDNHGFAMSTSDRHLTRLAVSAQMGSVDSLAPPVDETGAPPTYEEATSTAV